MRVIDPVINLNNGAYIIFDHNQQKFTLLKQQIKFDKFGKIQNSKV